MYFAMQSKGFLAHDENPTVSFRAKREILACLQIRLDR